MKNQLLLLSFILSLMVSGCGAKDSKEGWDYQYEVKEKGTRSEHIAGLLFFKNNEISKNLAHVITPIGEFIFMGKPLWGSPPNWVPCLIRPDKTVKPIVIEKEALECLGGQNSEYRKTVGQEVKSITQASTEDIQKGWYKAKFEDRPTWMPSHWFYDVDDGVWIDPEKVQDYLQAKTGEIIQPQKPK